MSVPIKIYMCFTIMLIVAGLWFKRSRLLYIFQMLWMWILAAFNTDGMDYAVHRRIYEASTRSRINPLNGGALYSYLCRTFFTRGYEFYVMNGLISTGIFLFLYLFIRNRSKNPCFVASLFFLYPLSDCIIQKRWFFANVIVLAGIGYFFKNRNGIRNKVFLILSILIAHQIHVGSLAYLLIAALFLIPEEYMRRFMRPVIIAAYASIPILPVLAARVFPAGKVRLYFVMLRLGIGDFLFWTLFHLMFAVICWYIYYKGIYEKEDRHIKEVFLINRNMSVYLPLYYYEPTFIRFMRGLLLYHYIGVSNIQPRSHVYEKQVFLCTCAVVMAASAAFLIVDVIVGAGFEGKILPIFENNIVLNWLGTW